MKAKTANKIAKLVANNRINDDAPLPIDYQSLLNRISDEAALGKFGLVVYAKPVDFPRAKKYLASLKKLGYQTHWSEPISGRGTMQVLWID